MKTYTGRRDEHGDCQVNVVQADGRAEPLPLRLDLENHSPTGFNWGYLGSGPAQLALAILADALKAPARKKRSDWFNEADDDPRRIAVLLHQDFKRKFIAILREGGPWTITEQAVLDFVRRFEDTG